VAGISNAETVTVTPPATYTDGAPIVGTVTINVYTGGVCTGTPYGTGTRTLPPTPPAAVSITGTSLAVGTYSFVANATVSGTTGGCSTPVPYTYAGVIITGPASVPESTTANYTATGCATPAWTIQSGGAFATIAPLSGPSTVLTALAVTANQTVVLRAACGADFDDHTIIITNVASTTPGAPSIGTITR